MIGLFISYKIAIKVLMSGFFGFLLKLVLEKTNQKWLSTYHHTLTFILLPMITCAITHSIKSNIALSLGLVGALSIVRFRNPVKNTFELVLYFALISIGIIATVDIYFATYFEIIILISIVFVFLIDKYYEKIGKKIHHLSFSEGSQIYSLEIESNQEIAQIENSSLLVQKIFLKEESQFFYRLASAKKNEIIDIENQIKDRSEIKKIEVNY
tara:strand:+ start:988 stop:1623 length:636 start_codon:yes stop_codon:yes gene_type:complete